MGLCDWLTGNTARRSLVENVSLSPRLAAKYQRRAIERADAFFPVKVALKGGILLFFQLFPHIPMESVSFQKIHMSYDNFMGTDRRMEV